MPNELAFVAQREISGTEGAFLGAFRAAPYERVRLLAFCPFDARGGVELSLVHVEGEGAPGPLDVITLIAGAQVNQTYEVPGVILGVSARPLTDSPTRIALWIWGYRSEPGVPPTVGISPQPPTGARIVVRAVLDDGTGGPGVAAGGGVVVRVDGKEAGVTDESGALAVVRDAGTYEITAVVPSMAMGTAEVTVEAGAVAEVIVVLVEQDVYEPAQLVLAELVNGALALDTATITLRFEDEGTLRPVRYLYEVELRSEDPAAPATDLTEAFAVAADGAVAAVDVMAVLAAVVPIPSDSRLAVTAADDRGFSYTGTVTFAPGLFTVRVELEAPPSEPTLTVAGLPVDVHFGTGVAFSVASDAAGAIDLVDVPGSMLELNVVTEQGGATYIGQAAVAVNRNVRLRVRLLGIEDVAAGVVPWEVSPLATPVRLASTPVRDGPPDLSPGRELRQQAADRLALQAAGAPSAKTVSVAGAGENIPITQLATLTVPQDTEKVILRYLVSTDEYPFYVLRQSRYNDTWGVQVRDPAGAMLFSISRAVNSQLFAPPMWGPFGDTGTQQQEIDVSGLTGGGEAQLSVIATTTNIGDAILPTDVVAVLGAEPKITINGAMHDTVVPTDGASDRFSIPRPGDKNTRQRSFDLDFTKPDEVELTTARAELVSAAGVLQTVVDDEAVGTLRVQQIDETTMRVIVTFSDTPSAVASTPPPADTVNYRFTLTGRSDAGDEVKSDPKDSPPVFALWRMPDGFARYGERDVGGDDWAAHFAYSWLDGHRALVTRIDDISGEHAADIGHAGHTDGRQIDLFHVFTFPGGAVSGAANYLRLREAVERALAGDAAASGLVNAWAAATRVRFDLLIADADVDRIRYAIGSPAATLGMPELSDGWARALLRAGTYTNPAGLVLALPAGAWANAGSPKLRFDAIHNSHVHVDL